MPPVCEHMFVTSDGSPLIRLRRAVRSRNLLLVRTTAAELGWVPLADAVAIVELIEAEDGERFEAAAVRWAGRLAIESPELSLPQLRLAIEALDALPAPEARATLEQFAQRAQPGPRTA